jgi:carbamoyltransferase
MSDPFRVLGIHDNHNASVSLLEDGKILFSLQEERINGIKNFNGFPKDALARALEWHKIGLDDIDLFAFGTLYNPAWKDSKATKERYALPAWRKSGEDLFKATPLFGLYKSQKQRQREKFLEGKGIAKNKTRFYHHHTAHAASALYCSGFSGERTLVLTLDGGGDDTCAGVYISENGYLRQVALTPEGNSVGNLYAVATFYMGMTPLEHEYKLMGMAPYSQEKYFSGIARGLDQLLAVNTLRFQRSTRATTSNSLPYLDRIFRRQRFDAVCGALQDFTERLVVKWVKNAIRETGIRRVCLSGGVFMNVKLNKLIAELPEVEHLFVMPSCGDESNAMGASLLAYREHCIAEGAETKTYPLSDLYLGEAFDTGVIRDEIQKAGYTFTTDPNVNKYVAEMLAENKIVARCSGRSEWGARALGNRSILANPASFETVSKINDAIKMRDFWMPFAGTVPVHEMDNYLKNPKKIPSPYMMMAFDTTEKRDTIRAATHPKDKTIRPQILLREQNPDYYSLIEQFAGLTGTGCVLNTSFNLHGLPMVYHPKEALYTFKNSDLNILVMDDYIVTKDA